MEPRRPQVRAEVTVNGVPVHLVVDTAAPYSSLSREAATRAHVDLSPGAVEAAGQGQDVRSGALMTIVKARVAGLTFGSERQADVSVRISI
jgi:hypothetical protein